MEVVFGYLASLFLSESVKKKTSLVIMKFAYDNLFKKRSTSCTGIILE